LSKYANQWRRPPTHSRGDCHAPEGWQQLPLFPTLDDQWRPSFVLMPCVRSAVSLTLLLAVTITSYVGDRSTESTDGPHPTEEVPAPQDLSAIPAHIKAAAARYRVPEALILAIISVESASNPRAVSPKGAMGLMQLMPETAAIVGVHDRDNPPENIEGGVRHLRALMDRFGNNLPLILAAYNAGEQPVISHNGIPPYPETRRFVARVLLRLGDRRIAERLVTQAQPVPPPQWVSRRSPQSAQWAAAIPSSHENGPRPATVGVALIRSEPRLGRLRHRPETTT
jgi:transglycosylase-like protein with SLT domain